MSVVEIIITVIGVIAVGGGTLFAINKKTSKKVSQKNIHIGGDGKVIGGDDHSIINEKDKSSDK